MGAATGRITTQLRSTGRSSEHYGACEECRRHVSETYVAQRRREYRRANGELYSAPIGGGVYGHKACLEGYGPFDEIKESGRVIILSPGDAAQSTPGSMLK